MRSQGIHHPRGAALCDVLIALRSAQAQGPPTVPAPSVPAAMGHLHRGDAASAAKILKA